MTILFSAAFFICGFFIGRKTRLKSRYDVYKKTNGLYEPQRRS